jgi:polyisoprenoid-binding protein YceI
MIKRTGFVLVTMVGVALSMSHTAAAAEVARFTFSGAQASVSFGTSTSLTCADGSGGFAFTFGAMQGAEQISTSTGSPSFNSNGVFLSIDGYFNSCTGASISGASGGIAGGFSAPDKKLTSASITGSGTVQDFGSGAQLPVSIDVEVVGVGPTNASKGTSRTRVIGTTGGPISISNNHNANSNRQAEASGSITVDGVTFPMQANFALLSSNGSSTTTITK